MSSTGNTPDKLKILICLLYYFPHRTGLTIHVQRVAEELVRRGHDVTVLTARYSNDLPRDDTTMHKGVRIVRLWAPIRMSRGMIMPAYPWALYKLMREHDIVSVHTPTPETALIAGVSLLTGKNVVDHASRRPDPAERLGQPLHSGDDVRHVHAAGAAGEAHSRLQPGLRRPFLLFAAVYG